jgi:hypothetical protein
MTLKNSQKGQGNVHRTITTRDEREMSILTTNSQLRQPVLITTALKHCSVRQLNFILAQNDYFDEVGW